MKYALFLGCTTPVRLYGYEASTRKLAEAVGVELVDMKGAGCCGTPSIESIDHETALALAARNICIAEEMGMDMVTLCNGCYEVLAKANDFLKQDAHAREEVNKILAEVNRQFKGTVKVKHLVKMLVEDVGLENLQKLVKKPFDGLRVAAHTGCHLIRPSDILKFDDPIRPALMEKLVEITGAQPVPYPDKTECCGSPTLAVRENVASQIALGKVQRVKRYADIMVTSCPFCYLMYEISQLTAEESPNVPVVHLPQLLGLAMGLDYDDLALGENRIDPSKIMEFQAK